MTLDGYTRHSQKSTKVVFCCSHTNFIVIWFKFMRIQIIMAKHTYLQQLAMAACMLLGWPVNASPTKSGFSALESRATGFQLITNKQLLQDSTLSSTCQQVLQQTIGCDDYVAGLGDKTYHGSLGDPTLTNSVCTATCEKALVTTRRRISGACASTPDIIPGYPVISLIESVITGWNETCLKDTATGKYCNGMCKLVKISFLRCILTALRYH